MTRAHGPDARSRAQRARKAAEAPAERGRGRGPQRSRWPAHAAPGTPMARGGGGDGPKPRRRAARRAQCERRCDARSTEDGPKAACSWMEERAPMPLAWRWRAPFKTRHTSRTFAPCITPKPGPRRAGSSRCLPGPGRAKGPVRAARTAGMGGLPVKRAGPAAGPGRTEPALGAAGGGCTGRATGPVPMRDPAWPGLVSWAVWAGSLGSHEAGRASRAGRVTWRGGTRGP